MQGLIYNHFHNILRLFDVLPNFSPQVKRSMIITYKCGISELPQKLPNNLRLRILKGIRKYQESVLTS